MKRVDLADIGGADLGTIMRQQAEAQDAAKSEVLVYVMSVEIPAEGIGYTSVHRTIEGARRKLEAVVDQWGMRAEYEEITAGAVSDDACIAAGEEGDLVVWGISKLPVEE